MKDPIRKLDKRTSPAMTVRPVRQVVAALLVRGAPEELEIFICQRRADQPMALKWEFPGGKIEPGETAEVALARELEEELAIHAEIGERIATVHHTYRNGGAIEIQFFRVTAYTGELENRIFQAMQWSSLGALPTFDFLAADLSLIRDLAAGKLL